MQSKKIQKVSVEEIQQINSNPNTGVSVCIPRVFNNISWKQVKEVFINLNWGFVERVDIIRVKGTDGKMIKRAFIHFAPMKWNMRSQMARATLTALQNGETIKVSYDEVKPWFWTVTISKCMKPELSDLKAKSLRHKSMRKEKLDLSDVCNQKVIVRKTSVNDDDLLKRKHQQQVSRNAVEEKQPEINVNLNEPISARAASTTSSRESLSSPEYDPLTNDTYA